MAALRNIFPLNIAPSHSTECHMQSSAARILPDCPTSKDVVIEFALWVCNCHWLCIFCFLTFTQGIRFVFSGLSLVENNIRVYVDFKLLKNIYTSDLFYCHSPTEISYKYLQPILHIIKLNLKYFWCLMLDGKCCLSKLNPQMGYSVCARELVCNDIIIL